MRKCEGGVAVVFCILCTHVIEAMVARWSVKGKGWRAVGRGDRQQQNRWGQTGTAEWRGWCAAGKPFSRVHALAPWLNPRTRHTVASRLLFRPGTVRPGLQWQVVHAAGPAERRGSSPALAPCAGRCNTGSACGSGRVRAAGKQAGDGEEAWAGCKLRIHSGQPASKESPSRPTAAAATCTKQ